MHCVILKSIYDLKRGFSRLFVHFALGGFFNLHMHAFRMYLLGHFQAGILFHRHASVFARAFNPS